MALLSMISRRRRAAVVRPQVVTQVVAVDPAPEPEPAVAPVRTNPYTGLELALTVGEARLRFMRGLR